LSLKIIPHKFALFKGSLEKRMMHITEYILADHNEISSVVNLKLMNSSEMIRLNNEFRKKDSDTNILSFPASSELKKRSGELGDIAISIPYAKNEIQGLKRNLEDHMMHLLAHGILHLLGFDHKEEKEAKIMEEKEIKYLESFKIGNPYIQ